MAAPGAQTQTGFFAGGHDGVAADHQIGAGHANAGRANRLLRGANEYMAPGSAAFLRQAAGVLGHDALAFDVRSHAEQLADGDNAGATHPCDHHPPHAIVGLA